MTSIDMCVGSSAQEGESEEVIGMAWDMEKPRKWDPFENGEYALPHIQVPNEVNFLGGIGPNVGHPRSTQHILRPTKVQQIFNMRTRNQPVFTFCEDPRKANNVVVKKETIDYTNISRIKKNVERVRLAQNLETPPPSDFSEDPTEIFDFDNPLNLDLQGLDRKETFQRDEQQFQDKKEYLIQKRCINNRRLAETTNTELKVQQLQGLYGLPCYFDIDRTVRGDEGLLSNEVRERKTPWTDEYRVPRTENEPRLQRPIPKAIPYVPPPLVLATLVRTADKPRNIQLEADYHARRVQKLNRRQLNRQTKARKAEMEEEVKRVHSKEQKVFQLGEEDFAKHFTDELGEIRQAFDHLPVIYHEHKYPHTLRETKYLRRKLNQSRRVLRDETCVRNQFERERHQTSPPASHIRPEVLADDGSEQAAEQSEQSTDDEDTLTVGQKTDTDYRLRNFHYKMGDTMRGLRNVRPQRKLDRPPRTCPTRREWFDQMAPQHQAAAFFKTSRSSIPNRALPSDPDYAIFTTDIVRPRPIAVAPIHEMIHGGGAESAPLHAKAPKIRKPKYVKVRKFNLTAYMFGAQQRTHRRSRASADVVENKYGVSLDMIRKCDVMFRRNKNRMRAMRHNRMRTLGIPIVTWGKEGEDEDLAKSESESGSDWVPEVDARDETTASRICDEIRGGNGDTAPDKQRPSVEKCAPDFRESTFCRGARCRRPPFDERTASGGKQNNTYDVPRLGKLASDLMLFPNLETKKTPFTDLFSARFHHPHHQITQHKTVQCKYLPQIPAFQPPPTLKERAARMKPFTRALFRNGRPLQEDLAMPKITQAIVHRAANGDNIDRKPLSSESRSRPSKIPILKSKSIQDTAQIGAAEKSTYLKLLKSRHKQVVESMGEVKLEQRMVIDRLQFLQQLRDELDSIASCDSSETSSAFTNYTNDSGSMLKLEGKQVPCEYVTKSLVPFEEIDRCRAVTGPLVRQDEYFGPYYSVPFAGQKMDMRQLSLPKDKFFNSSVRCRHRIRDRLQVKVPSFDADRIGTNETKLISQLATEWDSYYQNEILTRPRVRKFKPITILTQARYALRKKFESNYIQEAITERAIVSQVEKRYMDEVEEFRDLCVPLFAKWQENYYRAYMRKMQDVKPFYEQTDQLKQQLQRMRDDYTKLNMNIIYMEGDWRRRTIMQNFHYLLGEPDWRQSTDWIHRSADDELENFRVSIKQRPHTNVRVRDKESAWAVKEFYEKFFTNELARQVHIVFPTAAQFMCGVFKLKMKSFMCLLELHFAMWVLSNLEHGHRSFCDWSNSYIAKRQKFVKGRCAKKYFNEAMAADLKKNAHVFVGEPLHEAEAAPLLRNLIALSETMFKEMIPQSVRDNMKSGANVVDKFTMIVNAATQILNELEHIPHDVRVGVERKVRQRRALLNRQAVRACDLEARIKLTAKQMRKCLAPPHQKKPPTHPLARSHLEANVRPPKVVKIEITALDKLFYKAFTDKPAQHMSFQSADDAAILRALEANCIPFYFDFFLRQNNYFPSYDFQTEIELHEGSEFEHFHYEDVLDDVHEKLMQWEQNKQQRMDEHIQQTWHLYRSSDQPEL